MRLVTSLLLFMATATAQRLGRDTGELSYDGRRCYRSISGATVKCPSDHPLCATRVIIIPTGTREDMKPVLGCAAASTQRPCSLTYRAGYAYSMTCVCTYQLCNALFTEQLLDDLQDFANDETRMILKGAANEFADEFWNKSRFSNTPREELYGIITKNKRDDLLVELNDGDYNTGEKMPVPVALRGATAEPSDDEEDDAEGSGLDEEHQSHASHGTGPAPYASPKPSPPKPTQASAASPLHRYPIFLSHLLILAITI